MWTPISPFTAALAWKEGVGWLFIKDSCNWKSQSAAHCNFLATSVNNKTREAGRMFSGLGSVTGTKSDTARHTRVQSNNPLETHCQPCYYQQRNFHGGAFSGINEANQIESSAVRDPGVISLSTSQIIVLILLKKNLDHTRNQNKMNVYI